LLCSARAQVNEEECPYKQTLRSTPTETIISCRGEKSEVLPNQKWVYDAGSKKLAGHYSYPPVAMQRVFAVDGGVVVVGSVTVEYRGGRFRVLSPNEAKPWITRGVVTTTAPQDMPSLRQSSYDDFARARPQRVQNGYNREITTIKESEGLWQLEGQRIWVGKTFYDGEGFTGVGGFGYYDRRTQRFTMFAPKEMVDWSVSAMQVNPDAVWLGLAQRGEWGDSAGGLVKYGRAARIVTRFALPDVVRDMVAVENAIVAATEGGIAVIDNGRVRRYFVDRDKAGTATVIESR
jgi:hypothetical protein